MTATDLADLYNQRDAVAAEYAAMALWYRQPVERQGDTSRPKPATASAWGPWQGSPT